MDKKIPLYIYMSESYDACSSWKKKKKEMLFSEVTASWGLHVGSRWSSPLQWFLWELSIWLRQSRVLIDQGQDKLACTLLEKFGERARKSCRSRDLGEKTGRGRSWLRQTASGACNLSPMGTARLLEYRAGGAGGTRSTPGNHRNLPNGLLMSCFFLFS